MKIFDFTKLTETVSAYIETRIELLKLDLQEQAVGFIAKTLTWGLIGLCGLTFLLFISLGISALVNQWLESEFLGYLVVAGLYLLCGLVVYFAKDAIELKVRKGVSNSGLLDEILEEDEQ